MNPELSVIIPTLNEEDYIGSCLQSLSEQTFRNFEVIVVDSQSEDKTVEIAKSFGAEVISMGRRGPGAARNVGANHAKGEILVFLDADVIASKNLLEEIRKCFEDPRIVGATCKIFSRRKGAKYKFFYKIGYLAMRFSFPFRPGIPGHSAFYRKETFFRVGGFKENLEHSEDLDLSYRISKLGKIKVIKDAFVKVSPRRVDKWGFWTLFFRYVKYFVAFQLLGRPVGKYWDR